MLSRDQILQAADNGATAVDVPEWGGSVYVRIMSGRERDAFEAQMIASKDRSMENFRAKMAAVCVCDDQGKRIFSDQDVEALGAKSSTALQRIFDAALRINRMAPGDVEELRKN